MQEAREQNAQLHSDKQQLKQQCQLAQALATAPDRPAMDAALQQAVQDLQQQNRDLTAQLTATTEANDRLR